MNWGVGMNGGVEIKGGSGNEGEREGEVGTEIKDEEEDNEWS